jgi:uncharacterized RDD family membrane protein YckC
MSQAIIETEEVLIIETPERVPLQFALASIGNRFLACAVDHAIQYFCIILLVWILIAAMGLGSGNQAGGLVEAQKEMPRWAIAILIIVFFLVIAGYFVLFEWLWHGQTPGKRLLKLRVIREDGRPITFWEAAARNLLRIFDMMPAAVVPFYSIGLIAVFISPRDQRVGDLFAGTVVVRERQDEAPTFNSVFVTSISDSALRRAQQRVYFNADLSPLTEPEIEVVESFLRRRWDLNDRQRIWMAWRVALPLMYKLKPAYDLHNFTYEGFLEELLHRYNALPSQRK